MSHDENCKFINSLFLKDLIERQTDHTNVRVKAYSLEAASGSAEKSERSCLRRVLMTFHSDEMKDKNAVERLSFVVKLKPTKGHLAEEFRKTDSFKKEISVYKKVVPNMVEILKATGGKLKITPDLLYSSEAPNEVIFLEDLTDQGYAVVDPSVGLNRAQAKQAMEKLAFFHAASILMLEKNKSDLAKFEKGTFHADHVPHLDFFAQSFRAFVENSGAIGVDQNIDRKLQAMTASVLQKAMDDYNACANGFQVLNHGDFWTKNILFQQNGSEVHDTIFVDFQNCVLGSPVIDLLYFFSTSLAPQVLRECRDELVYTYYDVLTLILKSLNYEGFVPTLTDLHLEMLKKGGLEVIYSLTTAPYLRSDTGDIIPAIQPELCQPQNVTNLKTMANKILTDQKDELNERLRYFDTYGLLDWGAGESKIKGLMNRLLSINQLQAEQLTMRRGAIGQN